MGTSKGPWKGLPARWSPADGARGRGGGGHSRQPCLRRSPARAGGGAGRGGAGMGEGAGGGAWFDFALDPGRLEGELRGASAAGCRGLAASLLGEALGARARARHAEAPGGQERWGAGGAAGGRWQWADRFPPEASLTTLPLDGGDSASECQGSEAAPPPGLDARSGLVLGLAARAGLDAFPAEDVEASVMALEGLQGAAGLTGSAGPRGIAALAAAMARQCPKEQRRGRSLCLHRLVLRAALRADCVLGRGKAETPLSGDGAFCGWGAAAVDVALQEVSSIAAVAAAGDGSGDGEGLYRGLAAACLEAGELLMARRQPLEAATFLDSASRCIGNVVPDGSQGRGSEGVQPEARLRSCVVACRSMLPPDDQGALPALGPLATRTGGGGAGATRGEAAQIAEIHSRIRAFDVGAGSKGGRVQSPELLEGGVADESSEMFLHALGSPDIPTVAARYQDVSEKLPDSPCLHWLAACIRRSVMAATDAPPEKRFSETDFSTLLHLVEAAPGTDPCDLAFAQWVWQARTGGSPPNEVGEGETLMEVDNIRGGSAGPAPLQHILLKFGRPPCPRIWSRSLACLVDAGEAEAFEGLMEFFEESRHEWHRELLKAAILLAEVQQSFEDLGSLRDCPALEHAAKESLLAKMCMKLLLWIAESKEKGGEEGSQAALRATVSFMKAAPRLQVLSAVSFCLLDRLSPPSTPSKLPPNCATSWIKEFHGMRGTSQTVDLKKALVKLDIPTHVLVQKSQVRRFVRFLVERLRSNAAETSKNLSEKQEEDEPGQHCDTTDPLWTPGLWHWTQCLADLSLDAGFHRESLELHLSSLEEMARSRSDWNRHREDLRAAAEPPPRRGDSLGFLLSSRALHGMARACVGLQLRSAAAALLCWDMDEPDRRGAAEVLDGPLPAMPYEEPFLECLWDLPTLELLSEKAEQASSRAPESPNAEALQAVVLGLIKRPMLAHFAPPEVRRLAIGELRHRLLLRLFAWVGRPAGWTAAAEGRDALPQGMKLLVQMVEQFAADYASPVG